MRDDALLLYGFATEEERDLFLLLLGVQGVGPKMALAVLSGGPPRELLDRRRGRRRRAAAGRAGHRQAHGGADRRRAAREGRRRRRSDDPIVITRGDDPRTLARDGLVGLGFSPPEAEQLLDGAPGDTPEALIAHALKESAPVIRTPGADIERLQTPTRARTTRARRGCARGGWTSSSARRR